MKNKSGLEQIQIIATRNTYVITKMNEDVGADVCGSDTVRVEPACDGHQRAVIREDP
jgi:hypothetical protein